MDRIKTSRAGKSLLLTLTSLFYASPLYAVEKQAGTQAEFNAALGQADTTSIRLTGDIVRTTNPPIWVSTAPLGIEGDGYTLDGGDARRLLDLKGSGYGPAAIRDLDFVRNARFINGRTSGNADSFDNYGGAIRVTGDVINGMRDVQFVDNFSVSSGGAIAVGGFATLNNIFLGGNFSGGLASTPGTAMPTLFRGNYSGQLGSAVFVRGDFSGGLAGVEFSDNEAARIATFHVMNFLGDITNVTFDNNRSTWTNPNSGVSFGGAGFVSMGNVGSDSAPTIIRDSTFSNHQAVVGVQGNSIAGGGGAFAVASVNPPGSALRGNFTGSIIGSVFRDNTMTGAPHPTLQGGQVFGGGLFVRHIFKGNIEESQFINNKVVVQAGTLSTGGGAIALGSLDGSILGTDSGSAIFRENTADSGGAIQVLGQITGSISGTASNPIVFEDNHAGKGHGGAILANVILGGIHYGKFSGNSATDFGGAIRTNAGGAGISNGIDGGTVFENNQAGGGGGALSVTNTVGSRADGVAIDDVTFRNNTAQSVGSVGGAIAVGQSILGKIQNATFTGNQASYGGAIYTRGTASTDTGISEIASSNFVNNTAGTDGGAIWNQKLSGNLADSVNFSNNKAVAGSGGAIYVAGSIFSGGNISSQFQNNTAEKDGGAIYTQRLAGTVSANFTGNTAGGSGGAIYAYEVQGGILSGSFSDNSAVAKGGAAYYASMSSSGLTQNAQFYQNKTQQAGGALYVESAASGGSSKVDDSLFIGNSAKGGSTVTQASGLGGAIAGNGRNFSSALTINNSIFLRNHAETQDSNDTAGGVGGAVFFESMMTNNPTLAIQASGSSGQTLFYGNTHKPGNAAEASYNAIHLGNLQDAGQNRGINLRIETNDTAGDVLMFDPISSQADNLAKPGGGNYGNVSVEVTKTGVGNWFLGGQSQMRSGSATWSVNQGALHLVTVDYGSGAVDTQINLLGSASAAFTLGANGSLAGSGSIAARSISLNGYIAPNTQVNSGVKATALDPNGTITQADIDSIDVEETSTYGTLTFDTLGSGTAVTMNGAVYEVDLAWDNAGVPINDLIDIKGSLNVIESGSPKKSKSTIDVRGLSFQTPPSSTPTNDTEWDFYQPATVIKTTDGITGDFQLAVGGASWITVDYLRGLIGEKSNGGKDYDLRLGLSWYAPLAANNPIPRSGNDLEDPAHGTFTLADASNTFTVDGELKNREANSESGWNGRDLTKAGAGTLILNGVNTYTGVTNINAGTLVLGDSQAKATARIAGNVVVGDATASNATFSGYGTVLGNVTVRNGATLEGHTTTQGMLTVQNGGTVSGFGTVRDLAMFQAGSTVTPGGTDFGTLRFDKNVTLSGATFVADVDIDGGQNDLLDIGGILTLDGANNVVDVRGLTFNASLPENDAGFTDGSVDPFATLIKTANGIQGNLRVRLAAQVGSVDYLDVFGAKQNNNTEYALGLGLRWNSTAHDPTTGFDRAHGDFTLASGKTFTLDSSLKNRTVNVDVGGWDGQSLNKLGEGTLILNGVSTYTGDTTVTQGTLMLGDASHASAAIAGKLVVASGSTFTGTGTVAGTAQIDGVLTGSGAITGNATAGSGARLAPSSFGADPDFGTLRFGGNLAMDGARYDVNVDYGAQGDLLNIGGALSVNGAANVINVTGLNFSSVPPGHSQFDDGSLDTFATIIQTGGGISNGDKFNLRIANQDIGDTDFAQVYGGVLNRDYKLGVGLSWYSNAQDVTSGENTAHGNFTLTGNNTFTVSGALGNRNDVDGVRWNGASLRKLGTGTLVLNGVNTYTGETNVEAGALILGDVQTRSTARIAGDVNVGNATFSGYGTVLGGIDVGNNGILSGYASALGHVRVRSGAFLSPGEPGSVSTGMTFGSLEFDTGSVYRVKTREDGQADKVNVTNDLTIHGGTVDVRAESGAWAVDRTYTIIGYGGARAGSFDGVTSNFAFLTPQLDYGTANEVVLRLARNDAVQPPPDDDMSDPDQPQPPANPPICVSANQCNVGGVIQTDSPIYAAIETVSVQGARDAYDSLSGEIYGSTRSALLGSRYLRDAMGRRMGQETDTRTDADRGLWVHTWGQNGHVAGDGNAARVQLSGMGMALGADVSVNANTVAGAVFGYEDGKVKNGDLRNSRTNVDAYSLGAYLASDLGGVALRAGVAVSYLDMDTRRDVRAGTLAGQVKADYKGHKVQAFAEVARAFAVSDAVTVSPYVNLAHVRLRLRDAQESGNAAALNVQGSTDSVTQTTLGVRAALRVSDQTRLTADLGWMRSFGDVEGTSANRFATGNRFAVHGVGLDKNMALVGVGVQSNLTSNTSLSLGYQGQFGSKTRDHSAQLQLRVRF